MQKSVWVMPTAPPPSKDYLGHVTRTDEWVDVPPDPPLQPQNMHVYSYTQHNTLFCADAERAPINDVHDVCSPRIVSVSCRNYRFFSAGSGQVWEAIMKLTEGRKQARMVLSFIDASAQGEWLCGKTRKVGQMFCIACYVGNTLVMCYLRT